MFENTYKNRLHMTEGTQNKPVRNLKKLRNLFSYDMMYHGLPECNFLTVSVVIVVDLFSESVVL
jgi:hypothetical protein